ncbi:MAG: hypothetical protein HY245_01170 [Rhizobiales bacterium]|nr:hypothetical protein [Hyphomicrobiales bacterium]MBI3672041.1 hypothetical protein [Hyphomicrobiales bacterium]
MRVWALSAGVALLLLSPAAGAASLCNCCGEGTAASCAKTCETAKPPQGQCTVVVDYAGTAEISPGVNPLYGVSLRNLVVGTPDKVQSELLRRLLEAARRGAENDRRISFRDYERGKIDRAGAAANEKRYEDAIVNYFLGMDAWRNARPTQ